MKYMTIVFSFAFFLLSVFVSITYAERIVAFGYLDNKTNDQDYDFLETIFPNAFAASIHAIYKTEVKKPMQIQEELNLHNQSLKKNYNIFELKGLSKMINADLFVFGSFNLLPKNRIKITLNTYLNGNDEIFSFTNIGKMETEISRLVDRITIIVINLMNEDSFFRSNKIMPGKKLAILTNLGAEEQNRVLITFMNNGYSINCFQIDSLYNIIDDSSIENFRFIRTGYNSYDIVEDLDDSVFYHGSWTGKSYNQTVTHLKALYKEFNLNYLDKKDQILAKLHSSFSNNIDILLFIGFSKNRKSSWVRAIDMQRRDLVFMQSNINSDFFSSDTIIDITQKIINSMKKNIKNPFIEMSQQKSLL